VQDQGCVRKLTYNSHVEIKHVLLVLFASELANHFISLFIFSLCDDRL